MDARNLWARLSIRRKTLVWLSALIFVLLSMMGISAMFRNRAMSELRRLQENDTRCYTVQAALKEERDAFVMLLRTRSQTDLQGYEAACDESEAALNALPDNYAILGEECSARTWNLKNGYEGYREYRDALVAMDPGEPNYSAAYYRVLDMLDHLSVYALRLGQATMEQGSDIYRRTLLSYVVLPPLTIFLFSFPSCRRQHL